VVSVGMIVKALWGLCEDVCGDVFRHVSCLFTLLNGVSIEMSRFMIVIVRVCRVFLIPHAGDWEGHRVGL